jgi:hypothetical protein
VQHNPVIKAFYQRLCAAAKPRKVALCAAASKEQDFGPAYITRLRSEVVAA